MQNIAENRALTVARYENLTLIAADTIGELRVLDVYRVLETAMSCPGLDVTDCGAWIKEQRYSPEDERIRGEVDKCLIELGFDALGKATEDLV